MKRRFTGSILVVLLSVFCMLTLCGAGKYEEEDENDGPVRMIVTTDGRYAYMDDDVVGIINRDYLTFSASDVTRLPRLKMALDKYNEELRDFYNSDVDDFITTALDYAEMMEENYGEDAEYMGCYDTGSIFVMRADEEYLSFVNVRNAYWGGEEEYDLFDCRTFDSATGDELLLDDVIIDDTDLDEILRSALISRYDDDEFEKNLTATNKSGDYETVLYDEDNPSYLNWCLTPSGIAVFFDSDDLFGRGAYVQLSFAEYPDIIDEDYEKTDGEYMIPIMDEGGYLADVDGDWIEDSIKIELKEQDNEDYYSPYGGYSIVFNDEEYDIAAKYPYDSISPYFVHRTYGDCLYVCLAGEEGQRIDVIRFIDGEPVFIKWLPSTEFEASWIEPVNEDYKIVTNVLTDPVMTDEILSFEELFCGNFVGTETESEEEYETHYEICCIDGRYYLNYIGDYTYGAAEIELLSDTPMQHGSDWYQLVKLHTFSGFSFAGDYMDGGEGSVCYLQTGPNCDLLISPGFMSDAIALTREDDYKLNLLVEGATENTACPELNGEWRAETTIEDDDCELFLQFYVDGTCESVIKREGYPVIAGHGIYTVEESDDELEGYAAIEMFGYANQPSECEFEIDEETGAPILTYADAFSYIGYPDESEDILFESTEDNDHSLFLEPGAAGRLEELKEMWEEYIGGPSYEYDLEADWIEQITDEFKAKSNADCCDVIAIEYGGEEGIVWLYAYDEVEDGDVTLMVDKEYAYYDLEREEFFCLFGNEW